MARERTASSKPSASVPATPSSSSVLSATQLNALFGDKSYESVIARAEAHFAARPADDASAGKFLNAASFHLHSNRISSPEVVSALVGALVSAVGALDPNSDLEKAATNAYRILLVAFFADGRWTEAKILAGAMAELFAACGERRAADASFVALLADAIDLLVRTTKSGSPALAKDLRTLSKNSVLFKSNAAMKLVLLHLFKLEVLHVAERHLPCKEWPQPEDVFQVCTNMP